MYDLLISFLFIIYLPFILVKLAYKQTREEWLQRLGHCTVRQDKYVWVHCASVGEVMLAREFISLLADQLTEYKVILSVLTPAGMKVARNMHLPVAYLFFLPFDHPFCIRRFVRRIQPAVLVLIETELWPNLIRYVRHYGGRVTLVNGRISARSYSVYMACRMFMRRTLQRIDMFFMREQNDLRRIVGMGARISRILVTGNMKYDSTATVKELPRVYKEQYGFGSEDALCVAGSIREGEEKPVIMAYYNARKTVSGLKLIIAPRHLNRMPVIERKLRELKVTYRRKSSVTVGESGRYDCLILDTFGELTHVYAIADIIFVGGSLVRAGGQNILEPAALGKMVLFGPSMENFSEPARLFKRTGGGVQVEDENVLAERITYFVNNPQETAERGRKARDAVVSMAGATQQNIQYIFELIKQSEVKKILIVQPSRIGDVIVSLPVLISLRRMYPGSYIAWLVDDRCAELIKGHKSLDEVIVFPFVGLKDAVRRFQFGRILREVLKLRKTLKSRRFDMTIDLHGLAKSAFAVMLAGASCRIASASTYGMKELSWLFSRQIPPPEGDTHLIARHLAVITSLGGTPIREFNVPVSGKDKAYVEDLLLTSGIHSDALAVLFPGGGWKSRRWLPERFARLADRLIAEYNLDIVFIGGKPGGRPEEGIIDTIIKNMQSKKAYDLSNEFSLPQLAGLLMKAKLYVGNDAGPTHLASAVNIPVVALLGPTSPDLFRPFSSNSAYVRKDIECAPCRERDCRKMDCMKLIQVDDVMRAVKNVLRA